MAHVNLKSGVKNWTGNSNVAIPTHAQ